jgi:hypothetical protein
VIVAVVVCSGSAVVDAETLAFKNVHYVDRDASAGNWLFRSNMPVATVEKNGVSTSSVAFAYDDLIAMLRKRALSEAHQPLPASFDLVDVSLNTAVDKGEAAERAFWALGAHAQLGRLVEWPLGLAGLLPPSDFPVAKRRAMAVQSVWKVDQLPARVAAVRANLTTRATRPQVYVVHCEAGCDRTGEFVGAYRMRYNAATPVEMYAADTRECGRSPNYFATTALEWFCLYLNVTGAASVPVQACSGFAKCKPFGHCHPT